MNASEVTDKNGDFYPDITTFPINEIRLTQKPRDYKLEYNDLFRFFNLAYEFYGSFDFYDNLTLWLNNINDISNEDNFEKIIKLYPKTDIDKWFVDNIKSE
jgi:hypothetical protein